MYREVRIEARLGSVIYNVCNNTAKLSKETDTKIVCEFNGTDIISYPDDDASEAAYQRWRYMRFLDYVKEKYGYNPEG